MKTCIIIHGTYGSPNENWFPWLKVELKKIGWRVFTPKFPTPKNQSLATWLEAFAEYEQYINEDTIFVGHSLGPAFILRILEQANAKIQSAYLISGFTGLLNNPTFD